MRPAAFVRKWAGTHEPEAIQLEGDVGKAGADVDRRDRVRSDPEHARCCRETATSSGECGLGSLFGHRWDAPAKVRFARDSPLEGRGFELSVPRGTDDALEIALFRPLRHFPFRPGRPGSFRERDQQFESLSLQRGVWCEP
jgi:hypothetical protein